MQYPLNLKSAQIESDRENKPEKKLPSLYSVSSSIEVPENGKKEQQGISGETFGLPTGYLGLAGIANSIRPVRSTFKLAVRLRSEQVSAPVLASGVTCYPAANQGAGIHIWISLFLKDMVGIIFEFLGKICSF